MLINEVPDEFNCCKWLDNKAHVVFILSHNE